MSDDNKRYCGGWINRQPELFPWLEEEIDPVTAKLEESIKMCGVLRPRRLASGRHLRPWPGTIF